MARLTVTLTLLLAAICCACSPASSSVADPDGGNTPLGDAPSGEVGCTEQAGLDNYAAGLKKPGDAGLYNFELVSSSPSPPALDDNTFVVRVTGADGKPVNGELGVTLDMPEHGHPSPKQPSIRFVPDTQVFTLDPMDLFMVGLWRITFSFAPLDSRDGAAGAAGAAGAPTSSEPADSAVFKFCIE